MALAAKLLSYLDPKSIKAPVLPAFTAVDTGKLRNVLHINGIQFLYAQIEDVCHLACSQATDIEMDRTEHSKLQNAKLSHQFRAVCLRSNTVRYT
jgi:hypothetical protein